MERKIPRILATSVENEKTTDKDKKMVKFKIIKRWTHLLFPFEYNSADQYNVTIKFLTV